MFRSNLERLVAIIRNAIPWTSLVAALLLGVAVAWGQPPLELPEDTPGLTTTVPQESPNSTPVSDLERVEPRIPPNTTLDTRTVVLYPEHNPTRVHVAILSGSGRQDVANTLAVLIGDLRKRALEQRIGLKVEVVNISRLDQPPRGKNIIFYRPPFLRAALLLAETVPGDQSLQPMGKDMLNRTGIDVEVWVAE